jgi:hypothetical protein
MHAAICATSQSRQHEGILWFYIGSTLDIRLRSWDIKVGEQSLVVRSSRDEILRPGWCYTVIVKFKYSRTTVSEMNSCQSRLL